MRIVPATQSIWAQQALSRRAGIQTRPTHNMRESIALPEGAVWVVACVLWPPHRTRIPASLRPFDPATRALCSPFPCGCSPIHAAYHPYSHAISRRSSVSDAHLTTLRRFTPQPLICTLQSCGQPPLVSQLCVSLAGVQCGGVYIPATRLRANGRRCSSAPGAAAGSPSPLVSMSGCSACEVLRT